MNQLPDWMYHAIEESFTCQFASTTASEIPVALPVFLNHFDPDTGTLIISSPARMKRVENVRQRPKVAILSRQLASGQGSRNMCCWCKDWPRSMIPILCLAGNGILPAGHDGRGLPPANR